MISPNPKIKITSDKIALFVVISIFTKELFTKSIGGVMVDFFGYTFFTFYFFFYIKKIKLPIFLLIGFLIWNIFSIISIYWLDLKVFPFIKQIVPIFLIFFSCYDILYRRRFFLKKIFELYLKVSFYVAIFGIFQWFLSTFAGINILIKEPGLLDSITYEPSHYAAVILPAAVYSIIFFKDYKRISIILVVSLILTFSLTSYTVLIFSLIIPRLKIIFLPIIVVFLIGLYMLIPYTHQRIQDRVAAMEDLFVTAAYDLPGVNGTVLSFASNLDVALGTLRKSPFWGSGIGGHESMYYKFFKGKRFESSYFFGLNYNSAHSLTIRILSEAGIIGFLIYILFLFKHYIRKSNKETLFFHAVSLACISHFLSKSLKLGGYIDYGTPFFFTLLIVNYIAYRNYVKQKRS